MRILIVAAGKVREPEIRDAVDGYVARLRRYVPTDEVEVRPGPPARLGAALLRAVPPRFEIWALDQGGLEPTSAQLAQMVESRMTRSVPGIALVVGAHDGLPPQVTERADLKLSLSRLTLPHRLARLLLCEQLYRAMTIIRGEPYPR